MSRIDDLFRRLRADSRKAFIPFVTAGDPDLEFTTSVVQTLEQAGCDMCELGVPYSDPIADGPVIQSSYTRVLANHVTLAQIHATVAQVTATLTMPLVAMVSYAIVYRQGLQAFVTRAKRSGFAGAIVPDLLVEEAGPLAEVCRREDFSLIQLVTPTTPHDRAVRIADSSTGFLYYVSVTGITGERNQLPADIVEKVGRLREETELPICIGFGISSPAHVRLLAPVADGLIVGSAIVRRIARLADEPRESVLRDIRQFAGELIAALGDAQQA